jgi:hypothetical protein
MSLLNTHNPLRTGRVLKRVLKNIRFVRRTMRTGHVQLITLRIQNSIANHAAEGIFYLSLFRLH